MREGASTAGGKPTSQICYGKAAPVEGVQWSASEGEGGLSSGGRRMEKGSAGESVKPSPGVNQLRRIDSRPRSLLLTHGRSSGSRQGGQLGQKIEK